MLVPEGLLARSGFPTHWLGFAYRNPGRAALTVRLSGAMERPRARVGVGTWFSVLAFALTEGIT